MNIERRCAVICEETYEVASLEVGTIAGSKMMDQARDVVSCKNKSITRHCNLNLNVRRGKDSRYADAKLQLMSAVELESPMVYVTVFEDGSGRGYCQLRDSTSAPSTTTPTLDSASILVCEAIKRTNSRVGSTVWVVYEGDMYPLSFGQFYILKDREFAIPRT